MSIISKAARRNCKIAVETVKEYGRKHHWTPKRIRRMARMVIMMMLTESGMLNYASRKVRGSMALPHDAVGSDHLSVGVAQQQVGADGSNAFGWGDVDVCQTVKGAIHSFLRRADELGLTELQGMHLKDRIQKVQVSYDPTGSNYARNFKRSHTIMSHVFTKAYLKAL